VRQLQETQQARARLVELFAEELTDLSTSSSSLATAVRLIAQVERGSFPAWLSSQLKKRTWSMRELAKRMNYNHSTVSRVISGEQNPTRPFCEALALALEVALPEVLDHVRQVDGEE
jgi:lambda repressor-like predicted transcriptional regulator